MALTATYISNQIFSVPGDLQSNFVNGERVRADCGTDGLVFCTVNYTNGYYPDSNTTQVVILETTLTSNLVSVEYGITSGAFGSLPVHTHVDNTEGGVLSSLDAATLGGHDASYFAAASSISTDASTLQGHPASYFAVAGGGSSYNGPSAKTPQYGYALDTTYQNTGTTPKFVSVSVYWGGTGTAVDLYIFISNSSPATFPAYQTYKLLSAGVVNCFFIVLPGEYYMVHNLNGSTLTLSAWTEWS